MNYLLCKLKHRISSEEITIHIPKPFAKTHYAISLMQNSEWTHDWKVCEVVGDELDADTLIQERKPYSSCSDTKQWFRRYFRIWSEELNIWQLEHRYVLEKKLGRRLTQEETVHHKDEDRSNNNEENLEPLPFDEHEKLHQKH